MTTYDIKQVENYLGIVKEMVKVKWGILQRVPFPKENIERLIERAETELPDEIKNFDHASNPDVDGFLYSSYISSLKDYVER